MTFEELQQQIRKVEEQIDKLEAENEELHKILNYTQDTLQAEREQLDRITQKYELLLEILSDKGRQA